MYYTIYKVTNNKTGMNYIGKHQTKNLNDGYMGSGLLIKRAIKAHGVENFTKEILLICESEEEMNQKEKELVIVSDNSYNLCEGGKGGFSYINKFVVTKEQREAWATKGREIQWTEEKRVKRSKEISERNRIDHKNGKLKPPTFKGKMHSEETKLKISNAKKGKSNGRTGYKMPEETKKKISSSLLKS